MDQNLKNLVTRRIKKSLTEAKISQTQLASMVDKSRAYVSNITKGRYIPKINELQKIAHYVNKPLGYFFGEDTTGLMHFVDKAKKWDKVVQMIEKDVEHEISSDSIQIPLVSPASVTDTTMPGLLKLVKQTKKFAPLSKSYLRDVLKYFKPPENLVAIDIFIRDYPTFGIETGDIIVIEPIDNNDIKDDSSKLFTVIYKNLMGLKRIYLDGNEFYFEPMNSDPQIDRVNTKDPNLVIIGKVLFSIHMKLF